ncbi:MAG: STT3 domain-containing protein [Halarcobacter sp.]
MKKTLLLITIAFLFSVITRLFWVYEFSSNENFKFNNEFIINSNDGFFYAEGARDILNGFHQEYDLSPVYSALSKITAFLVQILPFSFESIIFYMPIFFSSLIVIPLILLAKNFNKIEFGFISALLASISWSYYNRTMVGYYDTDMLNIVFPTFLLWSLVLALKQKKINIYYLLVLRLLHIVGGIHKVMP